MSISVEFLRKYIAYMLNDKRKWDGHPHKAERNQTKGLSPVTVNTRLKGPRTMLRWLEEEGYINNNPFHRIKKLKEPETNIRIMTVDELKLLLKAPNQRTYAGFRDKVMMHVLIDGFMRIGEVLTLRKSQVDVDNGILILNAKITKSRKQRTVPLERHTVKLLRELIEESAEFNSEYEYIRTYFAIHPQQCI